MRRIRVLDEATVNRIAAGEVIERPASVVKELVENSIDAGATRVEVEVSGAGLEAIRVADDGCGMSPEDAALAFERHATSKISRFEDLQSLGTLGFRGEGLASIAAVSEVELLTRGRDGDTGTFVAVRSGKIQRRGSAAREPGTTVTVKRLFANVPARLKYMRSQRTEMANIIDAVVRIALARPDVSFLLLSGAKELVRTRGDGDLLGAISSVFGKSYSMEMVPLSFERGPMRITGYAAKPALTRSDASHQSFFVNGRHFSSALLSSAVQDGYGSLVMKGRHPAVVLMLSVPAPEVDVNVHPTKREVRFRDDVAVYDAVRDAVAEAMRPEDLTPRPQVPAGRAVAPAKKRPAASAVLAGAQSPLPITLESEAPRETGGGRRILGQVLCTYILVQEGEELVIVDQHAAHERIVFEGLKHAGRRGGSEQRLLEPRALEADARTLQLVEDAAPILRSVGFDIEPFGGDSILVRSVPVVAGSLEDPRRLADLLADIGRTGKPKGMEERRDGILHLVACHSAIRAGERLEAATMERLVSDIEGLEAGSTCPHGRPTRVSITRAQLERMFGRRG